MNSLETTLELLSITLLCAVVGGGLLVVWSLRRACRYVLWQALGMLLLGIAYVLMHQAPTQVHWHWSLMTGWMLWSAAWAASQAMVARYGQSVNVNLVLLSAVCMPVAAWLSTHLEVSAQARWMGGSMALGLILAYALPAVWRGAVRHRPDQWLRALYSGATALVLVGPWMMPQMTLLHGVCLFAALCSVAVAWCAWRDSTSQPRTSGYRDDATHLLNRSGLDVVCGALPANNGITVVMLCELKGKKRTRKGTVACSALTLQFFAKLLQRSVREGDFVARTGTEEFVVALREMDMAQAQALVQRIQAGLPRFSLLESCSASFGLAQVHEMDSLDMALHRADVALYQSKEEAIPTDAVASVA